MNPVLLTVSRASQRSAALVHEDLRHGLCSLATIASTAPLVGILGTVMGIPHAFDTVSSSRSTMIGLISGGLAESLLAVPLGLMVGLLALWLYSYFSERLSGVDVEMDNARLDLLNHVSRFPGRFALAGCAPPERMFGGPTFEELERDKRFAQRSRLLACVMLALAWCAQTVLGFLPTPTRLRGRR